MLKDLDKVKYSLLIDSKSTFIANVLLQLKIEEDNTIPTANVDGITIKISSKLWDRLPKKEQEFVLAHEAWHVALGHTSMDLNAAGLHVPTLFKAADYTINNMLYDAGYEMPTWVLRDPVYDGLSTKEIYDILLQKDKNGEGTGDVVDTFSQAPSNEERENIEAHVEGILVKAAIIAEQAEGEGSIPSSIARKIQNLRIPSLPWHKILSKYLTAINKSDYSYKKFNRRFFPEYYIPSLMSQNKLQNIAIATDASGSVSDNDYAVFYSQIKTILGKLKPDKVTLLPFTTEIEKEIVVKKVRDIEKIQCSGYGGTYIKPVLEWAIKNKPKLLIIFSDMDFSHFPELKPSCPVIWIGVSTYYDASKVPFGKYIKYETSL